MKHNCLGCGKEMMGRGCPVCGLAIMQWEDGTVSYWNHNHNLPINDSPKGTLLILNGEEL